jgi:hypothetical protein
MRQCAENWIGYHFHFPLLWMPIEKYQISYKLTKKAEKGSMAKEYRNCKDSEHGQTIPPLVTS